jgi:hypothetical protein
MASFCQQLYVALCAQGFSETQALIVVGQTVDSAMRSANAEDDTR